MLFTYPLAFANILTSTRKHDEFCGFYSISTQTTRASYPRQNIVNQFIAIVDSRYMWINYPEVLMQKAVGIIAKLLIAAAICLAFLVIPKCTQAIGDAWDRQDAGQAAYIQNHQRELKHSQAKE